MPDRHVGWMARRGQVAAVFLLALAMGLAAACRPRLVYEPTPTAIYVTPVASPTAIPTSLPTPTQGVVGSPKLRFDPLVVSLAVGETRLVQVWLDNAPELNGLELHITYEPRYVQVEDADLNAPGGQVSPGVFPAPDQIIRNSVDNTAGLIVYQVAQDAGRMTGGTGLVASFMVRGQMEGGSSLRFNVVKLTDAQGGALPVPDQIIDGLVTVGAGALAPTPTMEALPTEETPAPEIGAPATAVPTLAPTPAGGPVYHTVQAGENLYRIALRYGVTVDAIVAANRLADPNAIQAGQVLLIPTGGAAAPTGGRVYVVQPGDTLYSIARRFGTTVDALAALNGIAPPYTVIVGQELTIP